MEVITSPPTNSTAEGFFAPALTLYKWSCDWRQKKNAQKSNIQAVVQAMLLIFLNITYGNNVELSKRTYWNVELFKRTYWNDWL